MATLKKKMSFCVQINKLFKKKNIRSILSLSVNKNEVLVKFMAIRVNNRLISLLSTIFLLLFNSMHYVSGQTDFALPVLKNANLIDKNSAKSENQIYFSDRFVLKEKLTPFSGNDSKLDSILADALLFRRPRYVKNSNGLNISWPVKRVAEVDGSIVLGGLMMIHEREDRQICGPIMPQGGIQALECMLHTIDWINSREEFLPDITIGAYVLDDCDKDTYGLEQSVDFIKGKPRL